MVATMSQLDAVTRTLRAINGRNGDEMVLTMSRVIDAGVGDVWAALTQADQIAGWFLPISGELVTGGRYQFDGNAGGTIEVCEPPRRFRATWEFGNQVTLVEVELEEAAVGCRFTLAHTVAVDDEKWAEFGAGAVGMGWDMCLLGLVKYVANETDITPGEAAMAWMASDDGIAFMTASSGRWRDASVAAGEDAAVAEASAARCLAAYAGS